MFFPVELLLYIVFALFLHMLILRFHSLQVRISTKSCQAPWLCVYVCVCMYFLISSAPFPFCPFFPYPVLLSCPFPCSLHFPSFLFHPRSLTSSFLSPLLPSACLSRFFLRLRWEWHAIAVARWCWQVLVCMLVDSCRDWLIDGWQLEYYKLCYVCDQMTASLSHWSSTLFVCLLTAGVLQAMLRVWPDDG